MLCLYKISQMMSICVTRKEGNIRNDINIFPSSLGLNASGQLFSPRFNRARRGHRCRDNFNTSRCQGLFDSTPVLNTGEIWASKPQFIKPEQAMGENERVLWRS
jgi:hypothetical protein